MPTIHRHLNNTFIEALLNGPNTNVYGRIHVYI